MGIRETNMDEVRRIAKTFLMIDYVKTPFSPIVVIHPFTNSGVVPVREGDGIRLVDITKDKNDFKAWQKDVTEAIENESNPHVIQMMMNKSYGLVFLHYAKNYLSHKDYSEMLCSAWISAENPNSDINVSKSELKQMFSYADPEYLMDDEEREQLDQLDSPVTVYRGVTSHNADNIRALSWTLNYDTAEWFSKRFGEDGTVYEAQIPKEHIYALFNGRNESEIILNPNYLTEIQEAGEGVSDSLTIGGLS